MNHFAAAYTILFHFSLKHTVVVIHTTHIQSRLQVFMVPIYSSFHSISLFLSFVDFNPSLWCSWKYFNWQCRNTRDTATHRIYNESTGLIEESWSFFAFLSISNGLMMFCVTWKKMHGKWINWKHKVNSAFCYHNCIRLFMCVFHRMRMTKKVIEFSSVVLLPSPLVTVLLFVLAFYNLRRVVILNDSWAGYHPDKNIIYNSAIAMNCCRFHVTAYSSRINPIISY